MTCEIVLYDAIALTHDFPLIGEEVIEIEFRTRNTKTLNKYKFFIHALEDISHNASNKGKLFKLKGMSVESVADARVIVQQTYQAPIDEIAYDLIKNYLQTTKTIRLTKTEGILKTNIPSLSPLSALELLRQQAVSNEFKYSPYVFFETASEISFVDIVSSYREQAAALTKDAETLSQNVRVFFPDHLPGFNTLSENTWRNIVALETLSSHDSVTKTHTGTFYSKLQKFDLLTKQYEEVETKLSDIYSSMEVVNGAGRFNTTDFIQQLSDQGHVQYLVFTDASRPKIPIDFLPQKAAFATLLFQNITKVEVHGDSTLKAGGVLPVRVVKATGLSVDVEREDDAFNTGFYLISKLAHHITIASGQPSMRTACELAKGNNFANEKTLKGTIK